MNATETYYFDEYGAILDDDELHNRYEDMLNEVWGEVNIAGLQYSTSKALRELDPIAYDCGFNDWLDSELNESIFEEDSNAENDLDD